MTRRAQAITTAVVAAARRLRDAEHVAAVIGGRAAYAELAAARTAMSAAAGIKHPHHPTPARTAMKGVVAVSNLADCVRITTKRSAVWRECAGCTALAALAPNETHCPHCVPVVRPARGRRLAA